MIAFVPFNETYRQYKGETNGKLIGVEHLINDWDILEVAGRDLCAVAGLFEGQF